MYGKQSYFTIRISTINFFSSFFYNTFYCVHNKLSYENSNSYKSPEETKPEKPTCILKSNKKSLL